MSIARGWHYERFARAIAAEPLPCALVDLDAFEANVEVVREKTNGRPVRVASKSIRSPVLLRRALDRLGKQARGVMTFSAFETRFLAQLGFDDLLLAYPFSQRADRAEIAAALATGARVAIVADHVRQIDAACEAAASAGATLTVLVDVDIAYRPIGSALSGRVHLGARRSPLHDPREVADFAERIASARGLELGGLMAYEAHIAGLPDGAGGSSNLARAKRAFKRVAMASARAQRRAVLEELARRGLTVALFNGGGTGSLEESAADESLSEVTAGSAFLAGHVFDRYEGLVLNAAAYFALAVTRIPAPGFATCQSGGFSASGAAGVDRLPVPVLPAGVTLTATEGAGEVQTPLHLAAGVTLDVGDPVFFRHSKSGELAEHFCEYLLVRGDRIESRAPTYRGLGRCFY